MAVEKKIIIPELKEVHNGLVERIAKEGFRIPEPNKVTGFRVGHIGVKNPKPNHPTSYGDTFKNCRGDYACLPVGYANYGCFFLVNTDKQSLAEYHIKLRNLVKCCEVKKNSEIKI